MKNQKVSIILGAGFSYVAGLPMASQLFSDNALLPTRSNEDKAKMIDVQDAFQHWEQKNLGKRAGEWLKALYKDKDNPLAKMIHRTSSEDAIGFGLRRLTTANNAHSGAYYFGISRHNPEDVNSAHLDFWQFFESFDAKSVVTQNYNLLVEQALHQHRTVVAEQTSNGHFRCCGRSRFAAVRYKRKIFVFSNSLYADKKILCHPHGRNCLPNAASTPKSRSAVCRTTA